MNKLIKAFLLLFMLSEIAFAQTAALLPNGMQVFLDNNGNPLTSGTVDFYVPNTTTRKTTWTNSTETITNTNPVVLDAGGRAVIYGDGVYRQVVKDRNGNTIWDKVTSSTGTSGGGGTTVGDGNIVGTILPWSGLTAPPNYVFGYGQEISRVTYSLYLATVTSVQAIFCTSGDPTLTGIGDTSQLSIGTAVEAACLPANSTISSKTSSTVTLNNNANNTTNVNATFFPFGNGNQTTTFNVPDLRGRVLPGRDNMGGTTSSRLSTCGSALGSLGAACGGQTHILLQAELPNFQPIFTGTGHTWNLNQAVVQSATSQAARNDVNNFSAMNSSNTPATASVDVTPAGTIGALGSATPFNIIQPSITMNYIVKILPDTSSSVATGVASIGGMTGVIACSGAGLTCAANTITVNAAAGIPAGVDQNILNIQGGDYTIQAADCGSRVTLTGALKTITLPAVVGFADTCRVSILNSSSVRGQKLVGFPTNAPTILYPQQEIDVAILNGGWFLVNDPTRWRLTAAVTFNVATAGSNSNDGLATGAGGAFLTFQKCYDVIADNLDLAGNNVTCLSAAGQSYTGANANSGIQAYKGVLGQSSADSVLMDGNSSTFDNTIGVNSSLWEVGSFVTGEPAFPARFALRRMTMTATTAGGRGVTVNGGEIWLKDGITFGAMPLGVHMTSSGPGSNLYLINQSYTISGGAATHIRAWAMGSAIIQNDIVTISGSPAFSTAFAVCNWAGHVYAAFSTFTGAATGTRYQIERACQLDTENASLTFFPGDVAGTNTNGFYDKYFQQTKATLNNGVSGDNGPAGTNWSWTGANATNAAMMLDTYGGAGAFYLRRSDGTLAAPTALLTDDNMGQISWVGHQTTGFTSASNAQVSAAAGENWTDVNHGTYLRFFTTGNAGAAISEKLRIWGSGGVSMVDMTTDCGLGCLLIGKAAAATGKIKIAGTTSGTGTLIGQAIMGTPTWTLPTGNGTVAVSASAPIVLDATTGNITCPSCAAAGTPQDLTRTSDTNVTLTLGGTPTGALLQAVSITAGWTGTLSPTRGGCGTSLAATGGASQVLKQTSVGGNCSVAQLAASDLSNGTSGSGAVVLVTGATLVTPTLGVATATSLKTASIFPPSDSTTALQIFKADGATRVMDFDTTNARVGINKTPGAFDLDVNGAVNVGSTLTFTTLSATSLGASTSTITGLTVNNTPTAANDYYLYYSAADGAIRKCTLSSCNSAGAAGVTSLNGLSGGLNIVAGAGINVTAASTSVTVIGGPLTPGGRLTLTSGTPVLSATISAATIVYYTAYTNSFVPTYDGTNMSMRQICANNTAGACELSVTLGANWTTNTNYDWFVGLDSSTLRQCSGPAWSSDTARGTGAGTTELQQFNGLNTNKNSMTCRFSNTSTFTCAANQCTYVGSMRVGSAGQTNYVYGASAAGGTAGLFGIWNAHNRVITKTTVNDSTTTWTGYSSATFRSVDASTGNRVSFIMGLAEDGIDATYTDTYGNAASSGVTYIGIALDATNTADRSAHVVNPASGGSIQAGSAPTNTYAPQLGFHFIQATEAGDGTNNGVWAGGASMGLAVSIRN